MASSPASSPISDSNPETNTNTRQFISEAVDPILEKISKSGIDSLTEQEREILHAAGEKIAQRSDAKRHTS